MNVNAISADVEAGMLIWSGFGFLRAIIAVLGMVLGVALDPPIRQTAPCLPPETGLAVGIAMAAIVN